MRRRRRAQTRAEEFENQGQEAAFFVAKPQIPEMMAEVGVSASPEVKFWRKLETHDAV